MTEKPTDDPAKEEARHLAEEAMEEMREGHAEEARFVLEEARKLDPAAVKEVVHDQAKAIPGAHGAKPGKAH